VKDARYYCGRECQRKILLFVHYFVRFCVAFSFIFVTEKIHFLTFSYWLFCIRKVTHVRFPLRHL